MAANNSQINLPIVNAIGEQMESADEGRKRLQKSLRTGMLAIKKSTDNISKVLKEHLLKDTTGQWESIDDSLEGFYDNLTEWKPVNAQRLVEDNDMGFGDVFGMMKESLVTIAKNSASSLLFDKKNEDRMEKKEHSMAGRLEQDLEEQRGLGGFGKLIFFVAIRKIKQSLDKVAKMLSKETVWDKIKNWLLNIGFLATALTAALNWEELKPTLDELYDVVWDSEYGLEWMLGLLIDNIAEIALVISSFWIGAKVFRWLNFLWGAGVAFAAGVKVAGAYLSGTATTIGGATMWKKLKHWAGLFTTAIGIAWINLMDSAKALTASAWAKLVFWAKWLRNAVVATSIAMMDSAKALAIAAGAKLLKYARLLSGAVIAVGLGIQGMYASLLPALAVLAPFIGIALVIGALLYSLYKGFEDAKKVYEDTGSIWLAVKAGLYGFVRALVTLPLKLTLSLAAWVARLFGFDEFAKKLDKIDTDKIFDQIFDAIKNTMKKIGKWFEDKWDGLMDFMGFGDDEILSEAKQLEIKKEQEQANRKLLEGLIARNRSTYTNVDGQEVQMMSIEELNRRHGLGNQNIVIDAGATQNSNSSQQFNNNTFVGGGSANNPNSNPANNADLDYFRTLVPN
jgi:hypothetical protein